jgi:universal stress protein E
MATKRILTVVEPHGAGDQPVIARAAWLAESIGAEVELYSFSYDPSVETGPVAQVWAGAPGPRERILSVDRQLLEELAEPLRARGLTVSVDVAWHGPLEDAIARKVAQSEPWLVAKDVEHHNILQRTLLTNTDWSLIRHCEVPLLLVKPRRIAAHPTIIAAIDPMHDHDKPAQLDDAIVRFADGLAVAADGVLHLVHAFAMPMRLDLPNDVREIVAQQHRAAVADFLKRHHRVPSTNVHFYEGAPQECLQRAAEQWQADFVAMGAVARTGLNRLLIGSTAERLLDKLPCDVVILHPSWVTRVAVEQGGD